MNFTSEEKLANDKEKTETNREHYFLAATKSRKPILKTRTSWAKQHPASARFKALLARKNKKKKKEKMNEKESSKIYFYNLKHLIYKI